MRIQGVALGVLGSYNSGTPHVPVALGDYVWLTSNSRVSSP